MSDVNRAKDFPAEFDIDFYRRKYPLARFVPEATVRRYWETRGRDDGQQATAPAIRPDFVALFRQIRPILEIGPFDRPMVRGSGVTYFDVLDQAGLIEKARPNPLRTGKVPHIDFVSPTGDLRIVDRKFRAVCSSHAIEHQTDLVKHLVDIADLLENGGHYFLLMPDKRYCFDHFGAESTIADVIDAHTEKRSVHSLRTLVQQSSMHTHNAATRHWKGDHRDPGHVEGTATRIRRAMANHKRANGGYVDAHAWRFTPQSFRTIIGLLYELGLSPFVAERVYDTPRPRVEFTAILRKRG